jgi:predicted glycogen debranching enzyme
MVPPGTPPVALDRAACADPTTALAREWLETNGRGSYAMGTVAGGHTRRYHGLLTAARRPPVDRRQWVNRLADAVLQEGRRFDLSCQQYPDVLQADGCKILESFRLDPWPTWVYAGEGVRVEKSLFLRYGEDTLVVTYRLLSGTAATLEARPLLTDRDPHFLGRADGRFDGKTRTIERGCRVDGASGGVSLWVSEGEFQIDPAWHRNQVYALEEQRGLDKAEDVFAPGVFRLPLAPGRPVRFFVSTERDGGVDGDAWEEEERDQRRRLVRASLVRGPMAALLTAAADQFIVARGDGASVIAGYPWFGDWSRDALIAFPGLYLATGRWSEGPSLLDTFARHVHQGLLPNQFPEGDAPTSYNAVDAPLWFVRAVQAYHRATHDDESVRRWLPVMRDIVDAYQHGTEHGVRMDGDGLIEAPAGERAMTWMDAVVDGKPVTPRGGKPVEIQALWYNALQFLVEIQLKWKEPTRGYDQLAQVAQKSFNEKFWNADGAYLFDVIDGRHRDAAVRPNALFALAFPYEILEEKHFKPVLETAARELVTPRGLRSLARPSADYRPACVGGPAERDRAYHQGTVWPWLLGAFLTAHAKVHGPAEEAKKQRMEFLKPLAFYIAGAGGGQAPEIFDGDAPHAPRGCPAQAWSVGELLRVLWEEGVVL